MWSCQHRKKAKVVALDDLRSISRKLFLENLHLKIKKMNNPYKAALPGHNWALFDWSGKVSGTESWALCSDWSSTVNILRTCSSLTVTRFFYFRGLLGQTRAFCYCYMQPRFSVLIPSPPSPLEVFSFGCSKMFWKFKKNPDINCCCNNLTSP